MDIKFMLICAVVGYGVGTIGGCLAALVKAYLS